MRYRWNMKGNGNYESTKRGVDTSVFKIVLEYV